MSEEGVNEFECKGVQAQWVDNVKVVGGNALLDPRPLYKACLNAALLPAFANSPQIPFLSQVKLPFYALLMCLITLERKVSYNS